MYEPQQQINMAAESNVNQISNIDLAEEVTEETPQPVQNHMPEIDEEKRKEMMEEITKVSNYICVGCADTLVVACWTLASPRRKKECFGFVLPARVSVTETKLLP